MSFAANNTFRIELREEDFSTNNFDFEFVSQSRSMCIQ